MKQNGVASSSAPDSLGRTGGDVVRETVGDSTQEPAARTKRFAIPGSRLDDDDVSIKR